MAVVVVVLVQQEETPRQTLLGREVLEATEHHQPFLVLL
jgi:hypothetical protein